MFEAIHNVMHLYRAQQYRALREAPLELTHMEGKALGFFARRPGATLSDLVAHSGRDKGQLARLIGGLRERGLLDARADAGDRRTLRLQPTARGRALQASLGERAHRVADVAVSGLSASERRQLLELLARVRANLEDAG
ncbi:MAG: MarR family transcriptional regulator [Solimonas sp.]